MQPAQETVFFEDPEISVTCRRVLVHGRAISMEEVRAVEQVIDERPTIGWPLAVTGVALVATLIALGQDEAGFAFVYLVLGIGTAVWMLATRMSYAVHLVRVSGGSAAVVDSRNPEFSRAVYLAISEALSRREPGTAGGSVHAHG